VRLDLGLYGLTPRAVRRDFTATLIALLQNAVTILLGIAPEQVAVRVLALAGRSRLNQLPIHFSTWQSIARGQPSEIEYLNGAVVRAGTKLGIPTPYNARVVEMVHQAERTATFCDVEALYPDGSLAPKPVRTRGGGS
jgi:2-dehydropantoate 2-reductase